jgi:hypothetical protein
MKRSIIIAVVLSAALLSGAFAAAPAAALELYSHSGRLDITPEDKSLNCLQLEGELRELEPLGYNSHPHFYEDGYQGASMVVGTLISPIGYVLSGYSVTRGYAEKGRVSKVKQRIAVLRELKARKHCFES